MKNKFIFYLLIFVLIFFVVAFKYFSVLNWSDEVEKIDPSESAYPRPSLGAEKPKVVVVSFFDFQCPYSADANKMIADILEKNGKKVKFIFRHFPLFTIHTDAISAAVASECANDFKVFPAYYNFLFSHQNSFSRYDFLEAATSLGLDKSEFEACLDNEEILVRVKDDLKTAQALGLDSTPTFFIDGEKLDNWGTLEQVVFQKLK